MVAPVTTFDVSRPRFSLRVVMYCALALPVVVVVAVGVAEWPANKPVFDVVLLVLLMFGLVVVVVEVMAPLLSWYVRRSGAKLVRQARQHRRTTMWAGVANVKGSPVRFGLLTIGSGGVQYRPGVSMHLPESFAIAWDDVESVVFRPTFQLGGTLYLQDRDGQRSGWFLRGDCGGAFESLATIADSSGTTDRQPAGAVDAGDHPRIAGGLDWRRRSRDHQEVPQWERFFYVGVLVSAAVVVVTAFVAPHAALLMTGVLFVGGSILGARVDRAHAASRGYDTPDMPGPATGTAPKPVTRVSARQALRWMTLCSQLCVLPFTVFTIAWGWSYPHAPHDWAWAALGLAGLLFVAVVGLSVASRLIGNRENAAGYTTMPAVRAVSPRLYLLDATATKVLRNPER
jgi:hypothetical protein